MTSTMMPQYNTNVPDRTDQQRKIALNRANVVRGVRKDIKMDLKAGRASVHDLILEPPDELETMKLFDLMLATPKYGRVKVNKILQLCRISPSKTLGGLSQRQRTEVVSMLRR